MRTQKEPLFDLDDALLGHSCRLVVTDADLLTVTDNDLWAQRKSFGISDRSRFMTERRLVAERACVVEWFEPL